MRTSGTASNSISSGYAGYTWLRFHLSPFENVLDQTEAMQKVAPEGFKVHYDFTMHGTDDHMFELLEKLAQYRIAGCHHPMQVGMKVNELAKRLDADDPQASWRVRGPYSVGPFGRIGTYGPLRILVPVLVRKSRVIVLAWPEGGAQPQPEDQ